MRQRDKKDYAGQNTVEPRKPAKYGLHTIALGPFLLTCPDFLRPDIANPVSAYFFLSDDAQDEISGGKKKNMKCGSCGHRFAGEFYESCPKCYSANTEEAADEKADGYC